jgi:hypothetical protein
MKNSTPEPFPFPTPKYCDFFHKMQRLVFAFAAVVALMSIPETGFPFGERIHTRATRDALPFLQENVLETIVDGNHDEDQGDAADLAERHAQNCRFRDSAAYVNMRYTQVVDALKSPPANDRTRAARYFGHILHGIQDFYSHSNWIPTPPEGMGIRNRIIDKELGLWPVPQPYSTVFNDVVYIEGNPPAGTTVRLASNASGRVASAVPIVTTPDGRRLRGLMTSGAPRHPGDQRCPPVEQICDIDSPDNVCLRHGEKRSHGSSRKTYQGKGSLNLDGEGEGDWFQARHYARRQTQHEWCRLLHLSLSRDPSGVATGRLLGNWVAIDQAGKTPHIAGTPCQRGAARTHLVVITAMPGDKAPAHSPYVVFRSDFTSSARATTNRGVSKSLRICANPGEAVIAALVPALTPGATLTYTVPLRAEHKHVRDHRGEFTVAYELRVTPNAC